jgi:DNA repair photolyase
VGTGWIADALEGGVLMRWDSLRLDDMVPEQADAAPRPAALFERGAVTRTFDTPGFRGITFYEIHARSIINRVPAASRVPFDWTINPYRGCSHACSYCLSADTPILMANGRTAAIADLKVGDEIYGTVRRGNYRRYVKTRVLAHWRTIKPAYRVSLEDGTQLIASADHRFLSDRGWKHVTGRMSGVGQRPYLTTGNKLMGTGYFASAPENSSDYRRGYLCGMIRGDGCIATYSYDRPGRPGSVVHLFRLALTDSEALDRASAYLAGFGVPTKRFAFAPATGTRRAIGAIRNQSGSGVRIVSELICWPDASSDDWCKGFLAGIFDAEGSYSGGILRIANTDPEIIKMIMLCLDRLSFRYMTDFGGQQNRVTLVRIVGGLREKLRFFQATDPAITRKRSIEGTAIKSDAKLGVVSVEPLGMALPMYDVTTGTGDFVANGVVSHNCFARNTHTYLDLDAGADFNSRIVVKVNAPERARKELASPRWRCEHIAMGTNVDCYQRAEGRYRLMPGIIAALRDAANPFSILTKGTLILRDLELLGQAAQVTDVGLNVSVGFTDGDLWRSVEPGTPSPQRRLEACATLNESGLGCGVLMGPVIPYLSDSPAQLEDAVRQIAESGALHVSPIVLHLRPGAREWFGGWLREHHPGLVPKYQALYGKGSYAPKWYQQRISDQVRDLAAKYGVGKRANPRRIRPPERSVPSAAPRAEPEQLSLL